MSNKTLTFTSGLRYVDNAPSILACLLVLDSLHFVFARLLLPYLPPTSSSMYVMGIATVEIAFSLAIWDQIRLDVLRRHMWFFLSIGFLIAGSTVLTFIAVIFIDPGTASLVNKSSILFGVGFGLVWLRERLSGLEVVGAIIAIVGLLIVTFQPGDYFQLGSLIVLLAALMYALHAALVKRYSGQMSLIDFFLFRVACTTGFLFVLTIGRGELVWPGRQAWIVLFMAGTIDIVLSRLLYYLALRRLRLSLHSIILTMSPIVTIGWTLLLFSVSPTLQQLIGGMAILGGVLILTIAQTRVSRTARG